MRRNRMLLAAVVIALLAVSSVSAQPDKKFAFRFGLFAADPQKTTLIFDTIDGANDGIFFGDVAEISPEAAVGLTASFEWYASNLIGLEFGFGFTTHDIDFEIDGTEEKIGEIDYIPLSLGLNIHAVRTDRIDWYIGPGVAWIPYGDIELIDPIAVPFDGNGVEIAELEVNRDFAYGLVTGLDINLGQRWLFNLGLRWYRTTATIDTLGEIAEPLDGGSFLGIPTEIRVDPLEIRVGVGVRFGGGI